MTTKRYTADYATASRSPEISLREISCDTACVEARTR